MYLQSVPELSAFPGQAYRRIGGPKDETPPSAGPAFARFAYFAVEKLLYSVFAVRPRVLATRSTWSFG